MFYCMVIGSRNFNDYALVESKLNFLLQNHLPNVCIVSGGARGADELARKYAECNGLFYNEFPADWNKYGRSAGPRRNREMHQFISVHSDRGVVAFWDGVSRGTASNFPLASEFNNPIRVYRI